MKNNFLFLLVFISFLGLSQESTCNYKINVDTEEEIFKLTHESLIDFIVRKDKTIFIYFSLMQEQAVQSVVLHLSMNSTKTPPLICFNAKSKLAFKLTDGSFVSSPYLGDETCGRQTENQDSMNNSTSEASFYLDAVALKRLKNAKVESIRIYSASANFDLELREVIYNEALGAPIYPMNYFISNLKCIE